MFGHLSLSSHIRWHLESTIGKSDKNFSFIIYHLSRIYHLSFIIYRLTSGLTYAPKYFLTHKKRANILTYSLTCRLTFARANFTWQKKPNIFWQDPIPSSPVKIPSVEEAHPWVKTMKNQRRGTRTCSEVGFITAINSSWPYSYIMLYI